MSKYKIHKRRKNKNLIILLVIFAISTFFVSYGYSSLEDTIKITGVGNIKYEPVATSMASEIYEPMLETPNYANSVYTYENLSDWKQGNGTYMYEVELDITNLDKDYDARTLEVSFDVTEKLAKEQSKENLGILQAEKVLINGNRITVLIPEEIAQIKYGETLEITTYITYETELKEKITIDNVTLNGNKIVKKDKNEITLEDEINLESNIVLENNIKENEII